MPKKGEENNLDSPGADKKPANFETLLGQASAAIEAFKAFAVSRVGQSSIASAATASSAADTQASFSRPLKQLYYSLSPSSGLGSRERTQELKNLIAQAGTHCLEGVLLAALDIRDWQAVRCVLITENFTVENIRDPIVLIALASQPYLGSQKCQRFIELAKIQITQLDADSLSLLLEKRFAENSFIEWVFLGEYEDVFKNLLSLCDRHEVNILKFLSCRPECFSRQLTTLLECDQLALAIDFIERINSIDFECFAQLRLVAGLHSPMGLYLSYSNPQLSDGDIAALSKKIEDELKSKDDFGEQAFFDLLAGILKYLEYKQLASSLKEMLGKKMKSRDSLIALERIVSTSNPNKAVTVIVRMLISDGPITKNILKAIARIPDAESRSEILGKFYEKASAVITEPNGAPYNAVRLTLVRLLTEDDTTLPKWLIEAYLHMINISYGEYLSGRMEEKVIHLCFLRFVLSFDAEKSVSNIFKPVKVPFVFLMKSAFSRTLEIRTDHRLHSVLEKDKRTLLQIAMQAEPPSPWLADLYAKPEDFTDIPLLDLQSLARCFIELRAYNQLSCLLSTCPEVTLQTYTLVPLLKALPMIPESDSNNLITVLLKRGWAYFESGCIGDTSVFNKSDCERIYRAYRKLQVDCEENRIRSRSEYDRILDLMVTSAIADLERVLGTVPSEMDFLGAMTEDHSGQLSRVLHDWLFQDTPVGVSSENFLRVMRLISELRGRPNFKITLFNLLTNRCTVSGLPEMELGEYLLLFRGGLARHVFYACGFSQSDIVSKCNDIVTKTPVMGLMI